MAAGPGGLSRAGDGRELGEDLDRDARVSPLGAGRGLKPSETAYVARTRDRRPLRFSKSGDPAIERAYRTHWVSPELSERKRARLAERQSRPPELVVVSPVKDFTCSVCGRRAGGWLIMEDSGPVCMGCADMEHLVFLAVRRRGADAAGEGGQPPVGGGRALQPRARAVRAPGDPGRGAGARACRAGVPG